MLPLLLPAKPPFDLAQTLRFLKTDRALGGDTALLAGGEGGGGGAIAHAARVGVAAVALVVRGDAASGGVACEIVGPGDVGSDPALRVAAGEYVAAFLGLDDDLSRFYARAARDKRLAPVLERSRGYHPARYPTPLQACAAAILSQGGVPAALVRRATASIAGACGEPLVVAGRSLAPFPDAETLIRTPTGALRDRIGSERKARAIQGAARLLARADPAWLRDAPCAAVEEELRRVPGIGAWSAAVILLRGLGRTECAADALLTAGEATLAGTLTAARRVYGPRFDAARLGRALEAYGEDAGYWLAYLRAGPGR